MEADSSETDESVSLVQIDGETWSVLLDGSSYEVYVEEGACIVNGVRLQVENSRRRANAIRSADKGPGRKSVTAPMPGKVVRVLVSAGDEVAAGQGIVVVEAMKMQNEVKSSAAGRVLSLSVSEGDAVGEGAVLAVIG